jgi:hypothetical protein
MYVGMYMPLLMTVSYYYKYYYTGVLEYSTY